MVAMNDSYDAEANLERATDAWVHSFELRDEFATVKEAVREYEEGIGKSYEPVLGEEGGSVGERLFLNADPEDLLRYADGLRQVFPWMAYIHHEAEELEEDINRYEKESRSAWECLSPADDAYRTEEEVYSRLIDASQEIVNVQNKVVEYAEELDTRAEVAELAARALTEDPTDLVDDPTYPSLFLSDPEDIGRSGEEIVEQFYDPAFSPEDSRLTDDERTNTSKAELMEAYGRQFEKYGFESYQEMDEVVEGLFADSEL